MSEEKVNDDLSKWFSSYGIITAQRLLEKYQIRINSEDLIAAVKNSETFFYRILVVPVKNVLNGLILAQAKEYHLYVQKLFIDYLLSGESGKDDSFPGADTRDKIDEIRKAFVATGESFLAKEKEHNKLIADSQAYMINFVKTWLNAIENTIHSNQQLLKDKKPSEVKRACMHALAYSDYSVLTSLNSQSVFIKKFSEKLSLATDEASLNTLADLFNNIFTQLKEMDENLNQFIVKADVMADELRSFRSQFYETILQVSELLTNLSDYNLDPEKIKINKEALDFDKDII